MRPGRCRGLRWRSAGFWGYVGTGVIMEEGGWQHGPGADGRLDGATTGLYVASCLLAAAAVGLGILETYQLNI